MPNKDEETKDTSAAGKTGGEKAPNGANGAQTQGSSNTSGGASAMSSGGDKAQAGGQDAIALLKADHRKVEQLFTEFEKADDDRKEQIIKQACAELNLHTLLEEEIFYPACRQAASDEEPLDEAQVEHDSAKLLIRELLDGRPGDQYREAKFTVLAEQIKHHVAEEEKPREGIFAKAQTSGVDLADLGRRIQERKQRLQGQADRLRPSRPVSFEQLSGAARSTREEAMPRSQGPDRDERGRFMSDDDERGRGGYASERSGGGRGRYSDDDYGRSRGESRSFDRDDDRGYRSRSSRDDDADRGSRARSGDRGQGGWFGDPEGHSEASRRGWEERGDRGGRQYDDDDDRRYRSRGRDDDDDGRGWHGDPRGHAEAARRGWESRGGGRSRDDDDDDRRYRSRGRDDDDGRGGWFGDSRGHAEAARRGWENRR